MLASIVFDLGPGDVPHEAFGDAVEPLDGRLCPLELAQPDCGDRIRLVSACHLDGRHIPVTWPGTAVGRRSADRFGLDHTLIDDGRDEVTRDRRELAHAGALLDAC